MATLPSFSILMPSYNQGCFIQKTVKSVLSQNYPDLELIVIDGKSTDNTLEVLKDFDHRLTVISEKDNGQADALNKGLKIAKGQLIGWLNSDDLYLPGALLKVGEFFSTHPDVKWLFGHSTIIDQNGRQIRKWATWYKTYRLRRYSYASLLTENYISQMSVFIRRETLAQVGGINPNYRYAMDYDLWLKLGKLYQPGFIDSTLASFRRYETTKSTTSFTEQFKEDFEVARKHAAGKKWPILLHLFHHLKIVTLYHLIAASHQIKRKLFGKKPSH